jgi:uncharacterized protein YkwD
MYRVILAGLSGLACVAIAGCSLGTKSLSLSLNDPPATNIDPNFVSNSSLGNQASADSSSTIASYNTSTKPARTAMLQADRAPADSIKKAPPGALADRNYQETALNVAEARAMINAYRQKNGLGPVTLDAQLTAAAKAHSIDLAKWDRISHYGSDGSNPWDRVRRAGYSPRLAAENVGTGQTTLKEVFAGWKKSPGHNKNLLLKDAKNMGIALIYDAKTEFKTFWTLVLGTKS